jgi:hypothetical protein
MRNWRNRAHPEILTPVLLLNRRNEVVLRIDENAVSQDLAIRSE